jgi:hypothetical protein
MEIDHAETISPVPVSRCVFVGAIGPYFGPIERREAPYAREAMSDG